ncbi:MAG: class II fructose-bisphosphatase [Ardenticatenaceae bacterium]|nr:class II fructose-bisphosphatase [Anaerolineales bacterium]MCB8922716.1 class II fructose-bisphosphatase [Ardenticatenaceae bacterium]MCB9003579.1 class II fructose-bisphosphatase [Ardenticatenaceae bacterium]
MVKYIPSRNIGLDLVRVTETTALAAARWTGSGNYEAAHRDSSRAMADALNSLNINGRIVISESGRPGTPDCLLSGSKVGTGNGPELDVVVDPIDGTKLVIKGQPDAVSLVGMAPRGTMWSPAPAIYMEKIVVDREAAHALVPECMDAPAAWTLALIARVKRKSVQDLTVLILDRKRHVDLIEEVRAAGARIILRDEGDMEGALLATLPESGVDILMGVGGASQGVIAACAVKALEGGMLARLAPQSAEEIAEIREAGLNEKAIMTCDEIIQTNEVFFAATGVTNSMLLGPVQFHGNYAETHSLLLRAETGTRRFIHAEHSARV